MKKTKYYTLFLGYELPYDLDLKYSTAFPLLDKTYYQIDLEGDKVHLIPECQTEAVRNIIEKINFENEANLTCDFEEYGFLKAYEVNIWLEDKDWSLIVPSDDDTKAFDIALNHLNLKEADLKDYECFSLYEYE